jgi:fructose-1,6-bisphosphatase/inositol monophosphatase family enzyme
MPVIFEEAGGKFTGTDGKEVSLVPGSNVSGVASNGVVHDAVIAALNNR